MSRVRTVYVNNPVTDAVLCHILFLPALKWENVVDKFPDSNNLGEEILSTTSTYGELEGQCELRMELSV